MFACVIVITVLTSLIIHLLLIVELSVAFKTFNATVTLFLCS